MQTLNDVKLKRQQRSKEERRGGSYYRSKPELPQPPGCGEGFQV